MITGVLLEEYNRGQMTAENQQLDAEFKRRGLPVNYFTKKQMIRRNLPLNRDTLVAGEIPVVESALRQLGKDLPPADCYPECLRDFRHRNIWISKLSRVIYDLENGDRTKIFVKPRDSIKKFTDFVLESYSDLYFLGGTSRRTPVYCSEVVEWLSEYRVYVIHSEIVGIRHYHGDNNLEIDKKIALAAISRLDESGDSLSAYAIDFGVLQNGVTALVEVNDGYSIGSYELDDSIYADFTLTRWKELMGEEQP